MRQTVATQQERIATLLARATRSARNSSSAVELLESRSTKMPLMRIFSGKAEERSSTRKKSFIFNLRKFESISGYDEQQMLGLADCHLQDRARVWMISLKRECKKPESVQELQAAMIKDFVPQHERARRKARLM